MIRKVHCVAQSPEDLEGLRAVADGIFASPEMAGDYLLFSDDGLTTVYVVELSPSAARRLRGPGLCEHGRRVLMLEVVAAVKAAAESPSATVH